MKALISLLGVRALIRNWEDIDWAKTGQLALAIFLIIALALLIVHFSTKE